MSAWKFPFFVKVTIFRIVPYLEKIVLSTSTVVGYTKFETVANKMLLGVSYERSKNIHESSDLYWIRVC